MSQVNLERHHSKGWGVARHIKKLSCNIGDSSSIKKFPPRNNVKGPMGQDFFNPFLWFGQIIPLSHRHQLIFRGLARLEEEIVEFCRAIKPTEQMINDRDDVVEKITKTIHSLLPMAKVDTYGSYRTGLYLPSSDIDIVIFYDQYAPELLEKVRKYLIKNEICDEHNSYIINATVPIIRLSKVYKDIRIDISFNVVNAPASALFIQSCVNQMPELQPLIYILKSLLIEWELNESYFGGLSSYSLSLLLINFLRFFPRSSNKTSLGTFLLEFLYHYGCVFNANTLGVSYQHGFFLKPFPSEGLVIIDALDHKNDVARSSFKYREVQALFKGAYLVLSTDITENSLKILANIFDRKSPIITKQINLIRKHAPYRIMSNQIITRFENVKNNGTLPTSKDCLIDPADQSDRPKGDSIEGNDFRENYSGTKEKDILASLQHDSNASEVNNNNDKQNTDITNIVNNANNDTININSFYYTTSDVQPNYLISMSINSGQLDPLIPIPINCYYSNAIISPALNNSNEYNTPIPDSLYNNQSELHIPRSINSSQSDSILTYTNIPQCDSLKSESIGPISKCTIDLLVSNMDQSYDYSQYAPPQNSTVNLRIGNNWPLYNSGSRSKKKKVPTVTLR